MQELGLGYLSLDRSTPTLSPGELQRLRLATQLGSHLFGVIYVLDEPTTGLHPADADRLMAQLERIVDEGNTVVLVEHEMRVVARSDRVIDWTRARGRRAAGWSRRGCPKPSRRRRGAALRTTWQSVSPSTGPAGERPEPAQVLALNCPGNHSQG